MPHDTMYTEQYLSATYYKVEFSIVKCFHLKLPEYLDTVRKNLQFTGMFCIFHNSSLLQCVNHTPSYPGA